MNSNATKTLIVITGPTASGKTSLALEVASRLGCHIISADSRQLYHQLPIGTAAPTPEELARVPHHFVGTLGVEEYFSAAQFEEEVMELLPRLFAENDYAVMCGGSMMYVDAVTKGIDDIPTISPEVRASVLQMLETEGIDALRERLRTLDPEYYSQVDLQNTKRVVHAVEICLQSGVTYTSLRTGRRKPRPFRILTFAIDHDREELFRRINLRTDLMIAAGLPDEARAMLPHRHLNALNTVGYKEMFEYLLGNWTLPFATARLAKNTRVYAKKQLTWLRRDPEVEWLPGAQPVEVLADTVLEKATGGNA